MKVRDEAREARRAARAIPGRLSYARLSYANVIAAALAVVALTLPAAAEAKRNVYVTNAGSNNVSAFDIAQSGALGPIPGHPIAAGTQPNGVAVSPDGRHLYVANFGSDNVSAYAIAAGGSLAAVTGSPAGTNPWGVAVSPDGRHLYVTNFISDNVSAYRIDADGRLLALPGSPFAAGDAPNGVAVSPDGRHLYVTNTHSNNINAYTIAGNGSLHALAGSPFAVGPGQLTPRGVAVSPDGRHLYVANFTSNSVSAYTIAADGWLTMVGGSGFAAGFGPTGVAVSPDGRRLYVTNRLSNNVSAYTIAAPGSLAAVTGSPFAAGRKPTGVAVSPDGRRLYVTNSESNNVYAYTIAAGGSLGPVGGSPFATEGTGPEFQSVAITPNQGPSASFSVTAAAAGSPSAFDGSASADPDGTVARFDWDFGDGTELANGGPGPTHAYAAAGTYTAKLTVTDDEGCSDAFVFTGQSAHCNGSASAVASKQLVVAAPDTTLPLDTEVQGPILTAKKNQKQGKRIKVTLRGGAAEAVRGTAKGEVLKGKGKSFKLKKVNKTSAADELKRYVLKPKRKRDERKIRKLLKTGGKTLRAKLKLTLLDEAGNRVVLRKTVKLRAK